MALVILNTDALRVEEVRRLRGQVDLARPGALEALMALGPHPDVSALRDVATRFPILAPERFVSRDVQSDRARKAMALLAAKINKRDSLAFRVGEDGIGKDDIVRHSSGSLMLDWVTEGGWPIGLTQLKGEESTGKTFTALQAVATTIACGGRALWVDLEGFNSTWARRCGVPILLDIKELKRQGYPAPMIADAERYNAEVAEPASRFSYATGRSGDGLLQTVVDAISANVFDIIAYDSIAVTRRDKHLVETEVGKETQGGEAKLIGDFCSRTFAAFNEVEAAVGKQIGKDDHGPILGDRPMTSVLLLNQVREQGIGSPYPQRPDQGGGRGLRHAKHLDLSFGPCEDIATDDPRMPGRMMIVARRTYVSVAKSKFGEVGRAATVEMGIADHPIGTIAGRWGLITDLFGSDVKSKKNPAPLAEACGLVVKNGAWYEIPGVVRLQGRAKLEAFLLDPANANVVLAMKTQALQWIRGGDAAP